MKPLSAFPKALSCFKSFTSFHTFHVGPDIVIRFHLAGLVFTLDDADTVPEAVENVPVVLDFSGSDTQVITAPAGTLMKSVAIQKPADLAEENVLDGKNIAGIIGALVAGGGGETPTILKKSFYSVSDGQILFTAEELATIGFAIDTYSFLLAFPDGKIFATNTTKKMVLAFVLCNRMILYSGASYGGTDLAGFVIYTNYSVSNYLVNQYPTYAGIPYERRLSVANTDLPYFDDTDGCIKFAGGGSYHFKPTAGSGSWVFMVGRMY